MISVTGGAGVLEVRNFAFKMMHLFIQNDAFVYSK